MTIHPFNQPDAERVAQGVAEPDRCDDCGEVEDHWKHHINEDEALVQGVIADARRTIAEEFEKQSDEEVPMPNLPEGVIARLDITEDGVVCNLRKAVPREVFVQMLREVANGFENHTIERVDQPNGGSSQ